LWQVKAGSIFDNIIVTDSVDEAEAFLHETWEKNKDAEKAMFDKIHCLHLHNTLCRVSRRFL